MDMGRLQHRSFDTGTARPVAGTLSHGLFPFGRRDAARPGLGLGLWQEPEACLAPCEVDAHVQQRIGPSARACKFHDRDDAVGLAGYEGHGSSCGVVRGGIDAKNEVARSNSIAHRERMDPHLPRGKDRQPIRSRRADIAPPHPGTCHDAPEVSATSRSIRLWLHDQLNRLGVFFASADLRSRGKRNNDHSLLLPSPVRGGRQ